MFKKILVPVDIDYPETAAQVYRKAVAISKLGSAEIRLVTVMPGFGMPIVASMVPEEIRKEAAARVEAALAQFVADHCDPSCHLHPAHRKKLGGDHQRSLTSGRRI